LQKFLLDQAIEVVPDVIGMGGAAEMEAQLKVGELAASVRLALVTSNS